MRRFVATCAAILDDGTRCREKATHRGIVNRIPVCDACRKRCNTAKYGITVVQAEEAHDIAPELRLGIHRLLLFERIK